MCQVTPFTLPCCGRIYVRVEKLPSCSDEWPRTKCPKELCVQISGYEAKNIDHKTRGICWRCVAAKRGLSPENREKLRPVIDRATIAEGIDELTVEERRRVVEKTGACWFCGSTTRTTPQGREDTDTNLTPVDTKGKRRADATSPQEVNKKPRKEQPEALVTRSAGGPSSTKPKC